MTEWQPIETAPKGDNIEFLAWDGRYCYIVSWVYGIGDGEGWWGSKSYHTHAEFTHWMPLPKPPLDIAPGKAIY